MYLTVAAVLQRRWRVMQGSELAPAAAVDTSLHLRIPLQSPMHQTMIAAQAEQAELSDSHKVNV
jgi:hypothetical protein